MREKRIILKIKEVLKNMGNKPDNSHNPDGFNNDTADIAADFFSYEGKIATIDYDGLRKSFTQQEYEEAKESAMEELPNVPHDIIVILIKKKLGVKIAGYEEGNLGEYYK